MRRFKLLALLVLMFVVMSGGFIGIWYERTTHIPGWYSKATTDIAPTDDDANTIMQEIAKVQSWASKSTAGNPATRSPDLKTHTIIITERQMNAWWVSWSKAAGLQQQMEKYLKEVRVHLSDGEITIGGISPELGKVLSFELQVVKEGESVRLQLGRFKAGESIIPRMVIGSKQEKFEKVVMENMPRWKNSIHLDDRGIANSTAQNAYFSQFAVRLLRGEVCDSYLFIGEGMNVDKRIVTHVKSLDIHEGQMSVTFEALSEADRKAFEIRLQKGI